MRGGFVAVVAIALCAAAASAELSEVHRALMDGPAGYIATKAEKASFRKIDNDAEAAQFIELFWARRDPDLTTAVNEFKVDFDLRVAAADERFTSERQRGSMSDRGRTLIVMGRPFAITHQAPEVMVRTMDARESDERGGIEVWTYRDAQIPSSIKAHELTFIFVESRMGEKDYPLDRGERLNGVPMKLLAEAPERLLLHPDLKEVTKVGLLRGSRQATEADLAVLDAAPRPWPDGASINVSQGVQSSSLFPLWIHLRLPGGAPPATRVVGRVAAGPTVEAGSFAAPVKPVEAQGYRAYELSLPVGSGAVKVDLALLGEAGPIAVTTVATELEAVPADGCWISPVYSGADVRQESQATPGDPFDVGGWHVIPQPGDRYRKSDSLGYFVMVVRPGLSAQQQPAAESSLAVFVGDKKVTEIPAAPAELSHVLGDLWMFGSSLPLAAFPAAGDYRLEVTVRDTISGAKRTTSIPLHLGAS